MSDYSTRATVKLEINGQAAENALAKLDGQAKLLTENMNKAKAAGDNFTAAKLQKELDKVNKEIKNMQSSTERCNKVLASLDKASPKELRATLKELKAGLNNIERGSEAWNKQQEAIRAVKGELQKINDEQKVGQTEAEKFGDKFEAWKIKIAAAAAAMTGLFLAAKKAVDAFMTEDDALQAVRKDTGLQGEELDALSKSLDELHTRTSKNDLLKLADDAGVLGKRSAEDVLGYVKAIDQINLAIDGISKDTTDNFVKLAEISGMEAMYGTEESLVRIGSVINQLGGTTSANKLHIADFTSGIMSLGNTAGMTVQEMAAFGTVIDMNTKNAGQAATQMNKVLTGIIEEPSKYAQAIGVSLEEFNSHMENTTEGLIWMFDEIGKRGDDKAIIKTLGEMGLGGARVASTFTALAKNTGQLREQIRNANKAFDEGTSVTQEYNIMNETTSAKLEMVKKEIVELLVQLGQNLAPVFLAVGNVIKGVISVISTLVRFLVDNRNVIITLVAAWAAYRVAIILSTVATKANTVALGLWKVAAVLGRTAALGLAAATNLLRGNVDAAKKAFDLFKVALMKNPIGLVAAAITAVVTGLALWASKGKEVNKIQKLNAEVTSEANKKTAEQIGTINALIYAINSEVSTQKVRMDALNQLRKITGNANLELDAHNRLTKESVVAINDYINALNAQAEADAINAKRAELMAKRLELETEREKYYTAYTTGVYEGKEVNALGRTHAHNKYLDYAHDIGELDKEIKALNDRMIQNIKNSPNKTYVSPTDYHAPSTYSSSSGGGHSGGGSGSSEPTYLEKATAEHENNIYRLQIAYKKGEKNYDEYITAMEAEDKRYYEDVTKNQQVAEKDRLKLEEEYLDKKAEYEAKRNAKSIEEAELNNKKLRAAALQSYLDGKIDKDAYEEELNQIEMDYLKQKIGFYAEGTKERIDAEMEYNEKVVEQVEKTAAKFAEMMNKRFSKLKEGNKEQEEAEKEHLRSLEQLRSEYFGLNSVRAKQEYDGMMLLLDEVYKQELAQVGDNAAEKLRIEEAYQAAKLALAKKYNQLTEEDNRNFMQKWNDNVIEFLNSDLGKAITQGTQQIASSMESIFTQVSSLISAEAEIAENKLSSQYDAQISLAEGNKQKTEKLEKEKQAKIAKIKNEAEQKKFKMQVISTVAQTAISAVNAYSSAAAVPLIGYILAPIAATAAIAAGMLQVAALKKQAQASASQGYAEGGYTRPGGKYQVAGVVHAGEWVASQELLNHPTAAGIIHMLDEAQRSHSLGSLSSRDVSRSITAPHELAMLGDGGMSDSLALQAVAMAKYAMVIDRLNERLDEPFVTVNTVAGDNGIEQAQQRYNRIMRNKSR